MIFFFFFQANTYRPRKHTNRDFPITRINYSAIMCYTYRFFVFRSPAPCRSAAACRSRTPSPWSVCSRLRTVRTSTPDPGWRRAAVCRWCTGRAWGKKNKNKTRRDVNIECLSDVRHRTHGNINNKSALMVLLTWSNRPGSRHSDNTKTTWGPFPARTASGPVNSVKKKKPMISVTRRHNI